MAENGIISDSENVKRREVFYKSYCKTIIVSK